MTQHPVKLYIRLLSFAKPYRHFFGIGICATVLLSGIDAGLAWFIKPIINHGFIARRADFIRILPLLIVGIFILRGLFVFGSSFCIQNVGRSVVRDLRRTLFSHLIHLPAAFYDSESSGGLLSRMIYNVEQVSEATTSALLLLVQEGILALGLIIVMFTLSTKLTLFFMVILPLIILIARLTNKRLRRLSIRVQDSVAQVSHIAQESISGYKVIRMFGAEQYERDKFVQATEQNRQREMKIVATSACGTASMQVLISFAIAATLVIATLPQLALSAGSFAAFLTAMFTLLRPVRRINQTSNIIQKGLAGAQSIFELLRIPEERDMGRHPLKRVAGHIVFEKLAFEYPNTKRLVLTDIQCTIQPGETIALVGKSGGGKSTLVHLLPRFYDPTAGCIRIDEVNIQDYPLTALRAQFALVSQEVVLFHDSIANNIAYGCTQTVSQAQIIEAATRAHAMEFISTFEKGLDTQIGANGVLLSGGQRQRIAIARAILKNAPILILDEATSALDTESEQYIQAALEKLMHNKTTLVIAHRLSTIKKADRILVIDQGRIVAMGTHKTLLAEKGTYAKYYALQFAHDQTDA